MKNSPALCWIVDEQGNFLYLNPPYLREFKLSESDIGKNVSEIFPPQIAAEYLENNREVFRTGEALHTIEQGVTASGKSVQFKIIKFLIDEESRHLLGGMAIDITSEIEKKEFFAGELQRFELINRATTEVTWEFDMATGAQTKGGSYEKVFGYRHEDNINLFDHVHPDDLERLTKSFWETVKSGASVWEDIWRAQHAKGHYLDVISKAFIVRNEAGWGTRVVGMLKNISDEVKLKNKLLSVEMEMKRLMMKRILKAQERERQEISEDLHENLAQLLTTASLLLDIAHEKEDFSLVSQSRTVLNTAVNELRSIQQKLNPDNLRLIGLDNMLFNLVDKENKSRKGMHIQLHNSVENELLTELQQISIVRIVQEAIKNFLEHADCSEARIVLRRDAKQISLCIEDSGDSYVKAANTEGLGLSIIKARAEILQADLDIDTSPSGGCRINMRFSLEPKVA